MKMYTTMRNVLLSLIIINLLIDSTNGQYGTYSKCGLSNPKTAKDCTPYGTDTNFYCCYVENIPGTTQVCALVTYAQVSSWNGVMKQPDGSMFSCGNSSNYVKFSLPAMIAFLVLYFFI
jgi:hypothetical protein